MEKEHVVDVGVPLTIEKRTIQMPLTGHFMYDHDMLVDMFIRNRKFTEFTRANNPRTGSLPEDAIKQTPLLDSDVKKRLVDEVRLMRVYFAMQDELAEYMAHLPWKWWGRGVHTLDKEKMLEELIDLLHFVFVAVDDMGYTPQDIYHAYVKKNNHNWKRFKEKLGWDVSRLEHDDHPEGNLMDGTPSSTASTNSITKIEMGDDLDQNK